MARKTYLIRLLIFISLFSLCWSVSSCEEKPEKVYLDGMYANGNLNVGYVFFPDGTGYQIISQEHFLMEYEISEGVITITTLLKDAKITKAFPFEKSGDDIVIDGVVYKYIPDDASDGSARVPSGVSAW
ncbi:MAG TPA: hypothetical protein PLD48_06245 [Bacillota bacterium]|nr:hypothetical protein [Bacillota bacterium]HOK69192.1 hypothetical protein [Bacillota bacterium]HPP85186.1 hypothetical protein [Bacillota bacterium]